MQPNKHMNRVDEIFNALIEHFPPSIDENSSFLYFGMHAISDFSMLIKFQEFQLLYAYP